MPDVVTLVAIYLAVESVLLLLAALKARKLRRQLGRLALASYALVAHAKKTRGKHALELWHKALR